MKSMRILVPRLVDRDNHNPQNLNAKALLSRFASEDGSWLVAHYGEPDQAVLENPRVKSIRLWRRRLWLLRLWLFYLQPGDVLFYPGVEAADASGTLWCRRCYPNRPIIATLEGLAGTEARQAEYSEWAGHPVYCQLVSPAVLHRVDSILQAADHVIAISPFLAEMGRRRYGDKFSVLPLGIDTTVFHPSQEKSIGRIKVVSAGRVEKHKRPEIFLSLAERHPEVDFFWFGEGSLRAALNDEAAARNLENICFAGSLAHSQLADEFRNADIFMLPSLSEGVPKVTQEAAACGLPVVLFGYYEAPSVVDGENGFVVWDDMELFERVTLLIDSPGLRARMGADGTAKSAALSWDIVAPRWEAEIMAMASGVMP